MVAFLDRWFEFTTLRSLDECEQFVGSIPKLKGVRVPGVFRRESRKRKKKNLEMYKLCQYTGGGRTLHYAEASVQLSNDETNLVTVRGYGRVHLFSFAFYLYFIIIGLALAITLRHIMIVAILGIFVLFAAYALVRSFQNRNQLIEYIYENLA